MSTAACGHTIATALRAATARLAGSETPRLDAEVLLAHLLGCDRSHLLAHPDQPLSPSDAARYEELARRRAQCEPVAYLTGQRAWYDLTLRVTPAVLVPRPETEGLLERALAWARGRAVGVAADIGTGSGALAIGLARGLPGARVYATDLSAGALAVARENAAAAGVEEAISFVHGDALDLLPEAADLIVANLPYIGEREYEHLPPDVRLYEPRLALVGGALGHELLTGMLDAAASHLRPGAAVMAELGPPQARPALAAARRLFPTAELRLERDYAGLERYLLVLLRH